MAEPEIVVAGAVRTPIGSFGGALKDVDLIALATTACRGVLERSGTPADAVGHVVMGNVIPTEPRDGYLARVAAVDAGIPLGTPAFNVNRLCGSGLQAVISAAQSILLGDTDELQRIQGRYALVTMCIGGGQGIAAVFERC